MTKSGPKPWAYKNTPIKQDVLRLRDYLLESCQGPVLKTHFFRMCKFEQPRPAEFLACKLWEINKSSVRIFTVFLFMSITIMPYPRIVN